MLHGQTSAGICCYMLMTVIIFGINTTAHIHPVKAGAEWNFQTAALIQFLYYQGIKLLARSCELTGNYHSTLQLPSALPSTVHFSLFELIVLLFLVETQVQINANFVSAGCVIRQLFAYKFAITSLYGDYMSYLRLFLLPPSGWKEKIIPLFVS